MTPRSDEPLEPPLRITDRRRFANLDDTGDVTPASGSEAAVAPAPVEPEAAATSDDLEAARTEATQHLDHLRRLQAEFDNYRKRVKREMTEAQERGAEPVVRRLLEVLDDFELALMHAGEKPDFDRFLHGVELVYAKLLDALKADGVERMAAEGQPFDPELHEALMQTGEGEGDPVVADVLRPGYTMKGRVIRHAGVRVERG